MPKYIIEEKEKAEAIRRARELIIFGWIIQIFGVTEKADPTKYNELTTRLYELSVAWQQALLDKVERRVIGVDSDPDAYDPEFLESKDIEDIKMEAENELMARQRKLLEEIKGELA